MLFCSAGVPCGHTHGYVCLQAHEEAVMCVVLGQMVFPSMGKLLLMFLVWGKGLSRRTWIVVR